MMMERAAWTPPSNKAASKRLRVNHFIFLMETRWPFFFFCLFNVEVFLEVILTQSILSFMQFMPGFWQFNFTSPILALANVLWYWSRLGSQCRYHNVQHITCWKHDLFIIFSIYSHQTNVKTLKVKNLESERIKTSTQSFAYSDIKVMSAFHAFHTSQLCWGYPLLKDCLVEGFQH